MITVAGAGLFRNDCIRRVGRERRLSAFCATTRIRPPSFSRFPLCGLTAHMIRPYDGLKDTNNAVCLKLLSVCGLNGMPNEANRIRMTCGGEMWERIR